MASSISSLPLFSPYITGNLLFLKEPAAAVNVQKTVVQVKSPAIIWLVFGNVMLIWIIFFIIPVQIPFYLKSIGVEKNSMIGLAVASATFFSAISSFSFSRIKDMFSFRQIFGIGYLLLALAFLAFAYGDSYTMVLLGMLLGGLGMGLMIPNANVWVMQLAPLEIRGREIGRLTTFWFMGQFLSPIVLLPFLDYFTLSQLFYGLGIVLFGMGFLFFLWYWSQPVLRSVKDSS